MMQLKANRPLFALLLAISFLFSACGGSETTETVEETTASVAEVAALLAPTEEGIPYPIYESFAEMEDLLQQTDDRTYVINFWATWCGPCVAEMSYFEKLGEEADESVQIVMVSLDFKKDIRTKLLKFVEDRALDLPVVALADGDYNAWIDLVDPEWEGAIPYTLVYRGDKRVHHKVKFNSYEELQDFVAEVE